MNVYRIYSKSYLQILADEERIRGMLKGVSIGSYAWNNLWNVLDGILKRKRAYEKAVIDSRRARGENECGM